MEGGGCRTHCKKGRVSADPVSAATFLTRVESLTVLGITFNSKLRLSLASPASPIQLLDAFMA